MGTFNSEDEKNNIQMDSTNKLLLEMVKNQKDNIKNLVKVFIATIICYTILLLGSVIGFFIYESQFETIDSNYDYSMDQNTEAEGEGDAIGIINSNGDWSYGESETDN